MNTSPNIELQSVTIIDHSSNWNALSNEDLEELKFYLEANTEGEIESAFTHINLDKLPYRGLQLFAKLKGLKANADQKALRLHLKNIQAGRPIDETHYRVNDREPRKKAGVVAGVVGLTIAVIIFIWFFNK
jgi:hypothetical protein